MYLGIFLTLSGTVLLSGSFAARRLGLVTSNYSTFILYSVLVGCVISGLTIAGMGDGLPPLKVGTILPFVVTGALGGGFLGRLASTIAVREIGAARTHAIISASPLVTAVLSFTVLGERFSFSLGLGLILIVLGASSLSFFTYKKQLAITRGREKGPWFGLLFAFYVMSIGGIVPILRLIGLNQGATPLHGIFIRFTTGLVVYLCYVYFSKLKLDFHSRPARIYFIFAAVVGAIGPIMGMYALLFVSPVYYAALSRVGPLFTTLFAWLFLKDFEKITSRMVLGAAFIVAGAVLVSLS